MSPEEREVIAVKLLNDFFYIADCEFTSDAILGGSTGMSEEEFTFMTMVMNTNLSGLTDPEYMKPLIERFNSEQAFRSLWLNISIRFRDILYFKYGMSSSDFGSSMLTRFAITPEPQSVGLTSPEIQSHQYRLAVETPHPFVVESDFWLVCLFFYAINIRYSKNFQSMIERQKRLIEETTDEAIRVVQREKRQALMEKQRTKTTKLQHTATEG